VFGTYFGGGLRVWDVRSPRDIVEIAHFLPSVPAPQGGPMTNDVYVTVDGIVYITDRDTGGMHILSFER
jgi:uncharacterized protein (DUF39 family)